MLGREKPEMFTCAPKELLPWWVANVMFLEVGGRCFLNRGQLRIVGLNFMPFDSGSKQEELVQ